MCNDVPGMAVNVYYRMSTCQVSHFFVYSINSYCSSPSLATIFQCGHCKKLAPEWDKLAADWVDSPMGLVAEVDCTSPDGKKLCTAHRITGFPTIRYGDPKDLLQYNGGRTYRDLAAFCKANLKPPCSPLSLDSCTDEAVKQEWQAILFKSDEDIQALIAEERKKLKDANKEYKLRSKEMENQYNKILAEKETKIKEINESVLDIARSIKAFKEKQQRHGANGEEL